MGIARGWEKRVIRTNITYAKRTVRIFSVSPQSRSLFSASFQTFCLTGRAYLNTDCFAVYSFRDDILCFDNNTIIPHFPHLRFHLRGSMVRGSLYQFVKEKDRFLGTSGQKFSQFSPGSRFYEQPSVCSNNSEHSNPTDIVMPLTQLTGVLVLTNLRSQGHLRR